MLNILYIAYIYGGGTEIKLTMGYLRVDGMVLFAGIKKKYGRAWTVLISLKIGTDCGLLWAR